MPDAQDGLIDSLRRNRFCMGIGGRGKGYRCGSDAGEDAKSKAVDLLIEAVNRILKWHVWETWWIEEAKSEWLRARERLEVQLKGKYVDEVVNAITGLVDKFINYNEKFLNYWREVGSEVKELIEDLLNGKAEVIIRGEGVAGVSVHGEHVTLKADRARNSITVQLLFKGLSGVSIKTPDMFRSTMSEEEYKKFVERVLKALRWGFAKTDEYIDKGKAAMNTTQTWQAIVWPLLYPGEVHMYVNAININENDMTIEWRLRTSYESLKGESLGGIDELGEEGYLAFIFTAVLGDGSVIITKDSHDNDMAVVSIAMSSEEFDAWKSILNKLWVMGFKWSPNSHNNINDIRFYNGNAIGLARAMISVLPPILRDIMDALSFEKWLNLRRIAEMEVRWRRGESQVNVAGYGFTVKVHDGTIVLEHKARDGVEADEIINVLKANYGNEFHAYVNRSGKYLLVRIPMYEFEKHDDIKAQVIEVLCKKLEKTKDEKKRQEVIKQLMRLAPTKRRPRCL